MKFTYRLNSIGWAESSLEIEHNEVYMEPSYLSEPLIDLVRSVELLIPSLNAPDEVRDEVSFDWNAEPAIYSWRITKLSKEKLRIQIRMYEEGFKTGPGELLLNEKCSLNEFVQVLVESLELILRTNGLVGYRKQWARNDFPLSSYLQLKTYLTTETHFPLHKKENNGRLDTIESNIYDELMLIKKGIGIPHT